MDGEVTEVRLPRWQNAGLQPILPSTTSWQPSRDISPLVGAFSGQEQSCPPRDPQGDTPDCAPGQAHPFGASCGPNTVLPETSQETNPCVSLWQTSRPQSSCRSRSGPVPLPQPLTAAIRVQSCRETSQTPPPKGGPPALVCLWVLKGSYNPAPAPLS